MTPVPEPKADFDAVKAAVETGGAIVCSTKCWPCMLDAGHHNPPRWHTWADEEDVEHALKTGQPDPRGSRCGCSCAAAALPGGGTP